MKNKLNNLAINKDLLNNFKELLKTRENTELMELKKHNRNETGISKLLWYFVVVCNNNPKTASLYSRSQLAFLCVYHYPVSLVIFHIILDIRGICNFRYMELIKLNLFNYLINCVHGYSYF